jgi:hypothetical protein
MASGEVLTGPNFFLQPRLRRLLPCLQFRALPRRLCGTLFRKFSVLILPIDLQGQERELAVLPAAVHLKQSLLPLLSTHSPLHSGDASQGG